MRISNLEVTNFRAIKRVHMENIGDMVMIAGPNGCGKSCILDSIRLLKSVYGGYSANEWQQWFGEFQINFQRNPQQMITLLRDRNKSSITEITFELHKDEVAFLKANAKSLIEEVVWKSVVPGLNDPWMRTRGALAAELRTHKPVVDQKVKEILPEFLNQLKNENHLGRLEITPTGEVKSANNILLEIVFSSYEPKKLGLLDYHGSHRNYGREQLGGINLNLENEEDKYRQHILYNYANKYTNIKSEMAADYVRQALKEKSGVDFPEGRQSLADTLQELFRIFFPGKSFDGPMPTADGNLDFPVSIEGGGKHDINELSSGEKEVLFGYLRLRNSAPKYSIVLLDEPELHLNPALVRGLPQFYQRHLSAELSNQIWLVTHSDAFLRESVGAPAIDVYHMRYFQPDSDLTNQIYEVKADAEAETVILELVGDMAAYRPGAIIVFFEGENSDFDLKMVSKLFPDEEKEMNFVSGGNKNRVERLHRILDETVEAGGIPAKIYSIVDLDSGPEFEDGQYRRSYRWNVYHIENYLLEPKFILEAMRQIGVYSDNLDTEKKVNEELKNIARSKKAELTTHTLREMINTELVGEIQLNANVKADDLGAELHRVAIKSADRIQNKVTKGLSIKTIRAQVEDRMNLLETSLDTDEWKRHYRGRDILKTFTSKHCNGIRYEMFRDLIISTMSNESFKPEGMSSVIAEISND